jgi:hypothetical protein
MSFVLVQQDLTAPTPEQFRAAFRAIKGYTDADANKVAREAYGVLVRNLTLEHATAMQQTMAAQGTTTKVIPQEDIPRLPDPKVTRRVELAEIGLVVFDSVGRQSVLAWEHLAVIAAGLVPKVEMVKFETSETQIVVGGPAYIQTKTIKSVAHKLQSDHRRLLHLLEDGNAVRVEIDMDTLFYKYAMPDAPADPNQHFGELVRRLAERAPGASLNRGAAQLQAGETFPIPYASKATFADECTWLMWMATRPEA